MQPTTVTHLGLVGRLGSWSASHRRTVAIAWILIATGLGVLAPRAEHALSGGGWQADGSQSVRARQLVDRQFGGQGSYALLAVISSRSRDRESPAFRGTVARVRNVLSRDPSVASIRVAARGRAVVVSGGARAGTSDMVRAADRLRDRLRAAAGPE